MEGNIKIVIGSWGSYNECNERALGSKWLDLSDYSDWDEIREELKKEGFELDGIDEELFIQDVEGIEDRSVNWDYVNPETLFNTLKESGVLDDDYKYKVFCAFLEVRCYVSIRFNTSYSIVRLLTPNSFARFSLVSCRRRHKTSSMACRLSAAVISAVHLLFSNFLPAFYKSNSQVLCDFEKII